MISVEQIVEIEEKLAKATIGKDIKMLNSIYSDDYCYSNSSGVMITKEYLIKLIAEEVVLYKDIKLEEIKIRIYGDTAIMNGKIIEKGIFEKKVFEEKFRFIRVYKYDEAIIRVIGFQLTKLIV